MSVELVKLTPEEEQAIRRPASTVLTAAREFQVVTAEHYEQAGDRLKAVKAAQKQLAGKKDALVSPINQALRAVRDLFRGPESELAEAESLYKRGMLGFEAEQEELRKEEQRKADLEAERQRQRAAEQAEKAEAAARAAREAGNIAKAEKLEQKADVLADKTASIVAPVIQREAPRVTGIATREQWYCIVVDLAELVRAIAAGTVPVSAVEPNMKVLNAQAKSLKRELRWPGVRAVKDNIIAAGSK